MRRLLMASVVFLGVLPAAPAVLSPPKDRTGLGKTLTSDLFRTVSPDLLKTACESKPMKEQYYLTDNTEIKLNGHPCRYDQIPENAEIILLEVTSPQNQAILRLHFQTQR